MSPRHPLPGETILRFQVTAEDVVAWDEEETWVPVFEEAMAEAAKLGAVSARGYVAERWPDRVFVVAALRRAPRKKK